MIYIEIIVEGGTEKREYLLDENVCVNVLMKQLSNCIMSDEQVELMVDITGEMILNPMQNLTEQGVKSGHTILVLTNS